MESFIFFDYLRMFAYDEINTDSDSSAYYGDI